MLAPAGIGVVWRKLFDASGSDTTPELAVIRFKGRCDLSDLSSVHRSGVLGFTHVTDGVILHYSDIECDRIRSFIQRYLTMEPPGEREKLYGRVIARVVAHELYHMFANTFQHGSCGVSKAAYQARELTSPTFRFDDRELTSLRRGKTVENLRNSARIASPQRADTARTATLR